MVLLAKGDHSADGEKFSVMFDFTKQAKRLQSVTLKATDPSRCYIYKRLLLNKHGAPIDTGLVGGASVSNGGICHLEMR
jgi:hypothetical protein